MKGPTFWNIVTHKQKIPRRKSSLRTETAARMFPSAKADAFAPAYVNWPRDARRMNIELVSRIRVKS